MPGFLTDLISDVGHAAFNPENYRNKPVYDANNNITGFIDSEGNPTNNPMSRPGLGMRILAPSDTANLYKFNQDYAAAPVNSAQQREMATKAFQNDTSNTMGRMGTYGGATGNAQRGLYGTGLMDPSKIKAGNELGAEEAISNFYNTQARGSDFANTNALNFNKSLNEQGVPEAEATSKKAAAEAATAQSGAQIDEAKLAQIAAQYKMTPGMQSILKDTLKQTGVNALANSRLVDDPTSGHLFLNTYDPATGATTRTDLGLRPSASVMEKGMEGATDQTLQLPGGGAVVIPRSTTVGGTPRNDAEAAKKAAADKEAADKKAADKAAAARKLVTTLPSTAGESLFGKNNNPVASAINTASPVLRKLFAKYPGDLQGAINARQYSQNYRPY